MRERNPSTHSPAGVRRRPGGWSLALAAALALGACDGPQSALVPAGRDAEQVADLFFWMLGGAVVVWVVVISLAVYALNIEPGAHERRTALFVLGGGVVFPTVVLAGLLIYGLALMPKLLALPPPGGLTIEVAGEQWWWRVRYLPPEDEPVELANEIRLPVGERVALTLKSPDVIHSFWVPSLAGKMDMIPGRTTRLALEPTKTGIYNGVCAEYCGASHALMTFRVVVMERGDFDAWLAHQARPALPAAEGLAGRGERLFLADGCGACHTVRGTRADGVIGPDLTHVGSRLTLGAGILPNDRDAFSRWLAETDAIKPEVHMPAFGMLPPEHLEALAAYLDGLR